MIRIPDSLRADFQDACTPGFWLIAARHTAVVLLVVAVWVSPSMTHAVRGSDSWWDALNVLMAKGAGTGFGVSLLACALAALLVVPSLVWDRAGRWAAIVILAISIFLNPVVIWMAVNGGAEAMPLKVR